MTNFKSWLQATRLPFLTATFIPVLLGFTTAWHDTGKFDWFLFTLTFIGVAFMHTGTNLANDYYDHLSGNDDKNLTPTPFSGGSRVIQQGLIPAKKILIAALTCFALGSIIGLYLNSKMGTNVVLILGIIGVFLGFFYTARPIAIGYTGVGELAVALGFGPLVVCGAYYVQAHTLNANAFFISIPVAILVGLILFINEFQDQVADEAVGKRTLVVIMGKEKASLFYGMMLLSMYASVLLAIVLGYAPIGIAVVFLSLPIAIKAFTVARKEFEKINELLPANAATIGLHLVVGLLLCAGLVLDKVF